MGSDAKRLAVPGAAPWAAAAEDEVPVEFEPGDGSDERLARIVERPDGFHWIALDGRQEFGPFESVAAALADMQDVEAEADTDDPGEALAEAEQEFGIADWIDPDTGQPAEGAQPRIDDEH